MNAYRNIGVLVPPARGMQVERGSRLSRRKDEGGGRGTRDGGDEDEDSWKVRSPWRVILSLLLEAHSLFLSTYFTTTITRSVYFYAELCENSWRKYINASSVLDLAYGSLSTSLFVRLRGSRHDNFPISARLLVAYMKSNLFFFFPKIVIKTLN